ncbi:hypothetical protein BKP37_00475 [Anaerobacillus alkalilacustris]|uniref:Uncharacterized protein n=1 Tax=Anaerobacillus alkalilacustris TaxID=393763 RepID=A0A1S2LWZ7_9BACI|nr:hypothetical protein [Anaerobacillus alkalilacustris]OIJ17049.1 hypothetical protein BKP37_00475 [Anaerobacillus alkalilacustris]
MTTRGFDSFSKGEKENFKKLIDSYKLSPQQIAVVAAVLFNALYVQSILVDKDQTVVILLEGSLKRKNNPGMEKLLNEVKGLSIGELMELLQSKK